MLWLKWEGILAGGCQGIPTTVILHNKPHIGDLLGGIYPGGWLPLLAQVAATNWEENKVYLGILVGHSFLECSGIGGIVIM